MKPTNQVTKKHNLGAKSSQSQKSGRAEAAAHPVITPAEPGAASAVAAATAPGPELVQDPEAGSPLRRDNRPFVGLFSRRETKHFIMLPGIAQAMGLNDSQLLDQLSNVLNEHRNLIIDHLLPKIENPFRAASLAEALVIAEAIVNECGFATDLDKVGQNIYDPSPVQLLSATASYWPKEGGAK